MYLVLKALVSEHVKEWIFRLSHENMPSWMGNLSISQVLYTAKNLLTRVFRPGEFKKSTKKFLQQIFKLLIESINRFCVEFHLVWTFGPKIWTRNNFYPRHVSWFFHTVAIQKVKGACHENEESNSSREIYIHTCTHIHMYSYDHVYKHMYMYTHVHNYTHIYLYTHVHIHIHALIHTHVYTSVTENRY